MAWQLAGWAEARINEVVLDSARRWGVETAARYNRLVFAALDASAGFLTYLARDRCTRCPVSASCTSAQPGA